MVFTFGALSGLPLNLEIRRSALSCIPGMWIGPGSVRCSGLHSCQGSTIETWWCFECMLSAAYYLYIISVYSYSNQCLTQKIPSTKQRWRAEHIHAVIHLHYPVFLRHLVVFKFLFHRTFRQILEGRNEQTNTELTQILTKDLYRAQLVLCRMPDNK